jgi:cobalt/nickel transport system permease protein
VSGFDESRAGPAGDLRSRVHRLDARVKLIGFVALTVTAVAAGTGAWPVWVGCGLVLLAVAVAGRVPAGVIARRASVALPVVLLAAALLPFVRDGEEVLALGPLSVSDAGLQAFAAASAKAAIGTLGAVLLGATTTFPDVLRALEQLRVPRLFVLVARITWRYLFVVAGEVRRVRAALVSRGYRPRHALHAGALGAATGALFVRAHARGERVHQAMLARGGGAL